MSDDNPFDDLDPHADLPRPPSRKERSRNRWNRIVIGILMIAIGLTVVGFLFRGVLQAWTIQTWPTTPGEIVRSELKPQQSINVQAEALIEYRYEVAGRKYSAHLVRLGGTGGRRESDVAPFLEKYPLDQQMEVHYDPADPAQAYLEVGIPPMAYLGIVFPLLLTVCGLFVLIPVLRERDRL